MNLFCCLSIIDDNEITIHDVPHLSETIKPDCVVLCEDSDRATVVVKNNDRSVRALMNETESLADRVGRTKGDWCLVQKVS